MYSMNDFAESVILSIGNDREIPDSILSQINKRMKVSMSLSDNGELDQAKPTR